MPSGRECCCAAPGRPSNIHCTAALLSKLSSVGAHASKAKMLVRSNTAVCNTGGSLPVRHIGGRHWIIWLLEGISLLGGSNGHSAVQVVEGGGGQPEEWPPQSPWQRWV